MTDTEKKKETVYWAAFEHRARRFVQRVQIELNVGRPKFDTPVVVLKVPDISFEGLLLAHWAACAYRLRVSVHPDSEHGLALRVEDGVRELGPKWTPTPAQAAEAGYLRGATAEPMILVNQTTLMEAARCMNRMWMKEEALDAEHKVPLMRELGSAWHDACGYTAERLCHELDNVALGKFFSELALLTALEHPATAEEDRRLLHRYLEGKQLSYDHTALQDLSLRIKRHTDLDILPGLKAGDSC